MDQLFDDVNFGLSLNRSLQIILQLFAISVRICNFFTFKYALLDHLLKWRTILLILAICFMV